MGCCFVLCCAVLCCVVGWREKCAAPVPELPGALCIETAAFLILRKRGCGGEVGLGAKVEVGQGSLSDRGWLEANPGSEDRAARLRGLPGALCVEMVTFSIFRNTKDGGRGGGKVGVGPRDRGEGGVRGEGGGRTQFVHGRSRMTIGPRIPTMSGRSTSGFHQPGSMRGRG